MAFAVKGVASGRGEEPYTKGVVQGVSLMFTQVFQQWIQAGNVSERY